MNDTLLLNLLTHIEGEWAAVAITLDEVSTLRSLGLVSERELVLTEAGREKLASLREKQS